MQGTIFQNHDHGRLHREADWLLPQRSPDAAGSVRLTSLFNQTKLIFERQDSPREERRSAATGSRINHKTQIPYVPGPLPGAWSGPLVWALRNGLELHLGARQLRGSLPGRSPLCTATSLPTSGKRFSFFSKERGRATSFSSPEGHGQHGSCSHIPVPPTWA